MPRLATITIDDGKGNPVNINQADFNPDKHKVYRRRDVANPEAKRSEPKPKSTPKTKTSSKAKPASKATTSADGAGDTGDAKTPDPPSTDGGAPPADAK